MLSHAEQLRRFASTLSELERLCDLAEQVTGEIERRPVDWQALQARLGVLRRRLGGGD
jgi:hypothetical protein